MYDLATIQCINISANDSNRIDPIRLHQLNRSIELASSAYDCSPEVILDIWSSNEKSADVQAWKASKKRSNV